MSSSRDSLPPVGVLLVNLGSPEAPTPAAVRRYLAEFLGDPDVVRLPRWLWMPLLHGVILPRRAPRSAELYRSIWTEGGSPLVVISRRKRDALARELGPGYAVALAMRYGKPDLDSALDEIEASGARELVLVPLFPQYSGTTTGTIVKAVRAALSRRRDAPVLRVVAAYFEDPGYVAAVAERVRETVGAAGVDHYLFSFHGLPVRYVAGGDPYREHCEATAAALADSLGLPRTAWTLVYQSRFGRERWLEPQALDIAPELSRSAPRVAVVCPGFAADCLETLEEIAIQLGALFRRAGGQQWLTVPCLNDHPAWIHSLARLVRAAHEDGAP